MSDLDAMHYGRTGKNHQGETVEAVDEDDEESVGVGDEELWKKLR